MVLSLALLVVILFANTGPVAAQSTVLVQRIWGGAYNAYARAVATDRMGNVYVVGDTNSYGPGSPSCLAMSILKYSPSGTLLWQKLWWNGSYAEPNGVTVDSSGNVYIAGVVFGTCNGYEYGLLVKLDSGGSIVWQKTIESTDSVFSGIAVDASGNIFVTGTQPNAVGGYENLLVMRFDTNGALVWQRTWGGGANGGDYGQAITLDSSDDVYAVGTTYSFTPYPAMALVKFDSSGNLVFQKIIGRGIQFGYGVALDPSGNIYAAGTTKNGAATNILLVKFDPTGGPVWQKTWGGNKTDVPADLAIGSSGDIEIAGSTDSYGAGGTCNPSICNYNDMLLLELDESGNILTQLVLGTTGMQESLAAVADSFGTMVAVGQVSSAPPYQTGTGNNTLANSSLTISSQGNSTLGQPSIRVTNTNGGSLITPSGSQTFAGSTDEIMLRYGDHPRLTFNTTPSAGTITFNGTTYSNGQSITTLGNGTVTANPPSGYTFTGWNTTGGIFVSSATSNTAQATVAGSGTLTAKFQQTSYLLYYGIGGAAAATVALLAAFLYMRKKRRPSRNPTSTPTELSTR